METLALRVNLLIALFLLGTCHQCFAFPSTYGGREYALYQRPHFTESQSSEQEMHEQQKVPAEEQADVNTIRVACHPDLFEIIIKADMFGVGAPVDNNELHLGVEDSDSCRATAFSKDEYRIVVGLMDCGTKHWMSEASLVYTNLLIYSPVQSPYGLIRMDEAVIPIECHYERKYNLSSSSLKPTWIPFMSTQAAVDMLTFDLKLMTGDWLYERSSNVFHFGDSINVEASVRVGHHSGLRVFMRNCVATLHPDINSVPRYTFIENGCLVDSQLPGSRSHFLIRTQDDKLQLVIDAFRFHNDNRGELYFTCQLNAVPLNDAEAPDKACTFANRRWRSADGNDYLCRYCQSQAGQTLSKPGTLASLGFEKSKETEALWGSGLQTNKVWEQEAKIGPLTVLPGKQHNSPRPVGEIPPLLQRFSRPVLYGSQWRSGIAERIDLEKNLFPDVFTPVENERSATDITDLEMALLPTLPSTPDLVDEHGEDMKTSETDQIDLQKGSLPDLLSTPDLVTEDIDDMNKLDQHENEETNETDQIDLQKGPFPDLLSTPELVKEKDEEGGTDLQEGDESAAVLETEGDESAALLEMEGDESAALLEMEGDESAALLEKADLNIKLKSKAAELDNSTTGAFSDINPDDQVELDETALSNAAAVEFELLVTTNGPKK